MQTITGSTMPYGYRWALDSERDSEYAAFWDNGNSGDVVILWDCMIEFGVDHQHDPEACESIIAGMRWSITDDTDYEYTNYMYGSSRF